MKRRDVHANTSNHWKLLQKRTTFSFINIAVNMPQKCWFRTYNPKRLMLSFKIHNISLMQHWHFNTTIPGYPVYLVVSENSNKFQNSWENYFNAMSSISCVFNDVNYSVHLKIKVKIVHHINWDLTKEAIEFIDIYCHLVAICYITVWTQNWTFD